jgi:hypothetical protein
MKASEIASRAAQLVNGDRAETYGDCLEQYTKLADLWTQTLTLAGMAPDVPLDAHVVAWMMADLKKVRAFGSTFHEDSYTDGCGYVSIAGEIRSRSSK